MLMEQIHCAQWRTCLYHAWCSSGETWLLAERLCREDIMPLYAKPHVKQSTQKKLSLEYLLFYIVVVASPTLALVIIFAAVLPTNTLKAVDAGQLPAPALQSAVAVQD